MRNNTSFNKITIDSANRQRTRLPLAHDVNTTASIGDVQPLLCRQLLPKSNNVLKYKHLIRLDPMVAPTLARLSAKTWNHFVGLSDLLPRSAPALLTKAPISKASYNSVPSVPSELPNMTVCDLAAAVLCGASFTVYFHDPISTEGPDASYTRWRSYADDASGVQAKSDFITWIRTKLSFGVSAGFPGYNGTNLGLSALGSQFGSTVAEIPINCSGSNSGSNSAYRFLYPSSSVSDNERWEPVPLNSANYVLRTSFTESGRTYNIAFAVRLSSFGKRIRKILTGLGYRINLSVSSKQVDITPLFAYYKAYWDTFGLTLYDNWESSAACTLLSAWDAQEAFIFDWTVLYFRRFIYDLGTTFVTESPDYISAHQASDVVATGTNGNSVADKSRGFVNNIILNTPGNNNGITGIGQSAQPDPQSPIQVSTGHVYINRTNHTEVDAELLKTLYKWTNRQTVAGKRIKELLEAGGYGEYVKNCKSNFIGYNEVEIDISDINATADSTNAVTGKNSDLGTTVGKGVGVSQYEKGDVKTFSYETDELGYWVTLFAIVPESGWCQGFDPILLDYDADHKYNPDFDGLGMELEPKLIVLGESDWASSSLDPDFVASFGMVPRHTKYKVAHNIINGDFSLRGDGREAKLPFILDKYLNFGDREAVLTTPANYQYAVQSGSAVSSIPIAGNAWRYLNRYKWLNNFERIFNHDEPNTALWLAYVRDMNNLTNYELYYNIYDHFTCMNSLDLQSYARVLPVSDSYGTTEENNGNGDTTFTKA